MLLMETVVKTEVKEHESWQANTTGQVAICYGEWSS